MSFLTAVRHFNPKKFLARQNFDIVSEKDLQGSWIRLFIDQKGDKSGLFPASGVLLTCPRHNTLGSYSLALEPAGNIEVLADVLKSSGLHVQYESNAIAPEFRRLRMDERGKQHAIRGGNGKPPLESLVHYSGLVSGYIKNGPNAEYGRPVLDILKQKHIISEKAAMAIEAAIQSVAAAGQAEKFHSGQLERKMASILAPSQAAPQAGTASRL